MECKKRIQSSNAVTKAYYRLFYFFFRLVKQSKGDEKTEKQASILAILPLFLFGYIDLMTLEYLFSRVIYNLNISKSIAYPVSIGLISIVFNTVVFFQDKRYSQIKEMFSAENYDERFKRSFFCILYSLATLFVPVLLIAILGYPK